MQMFMRYSKSVLNPRVSNNSWIFRNFGFRVGDKDTLTKKFTNHDVQAFAEISLDNNPIHLDEEYARKTKFGRCIVHGVLVNGLISAVCSTKLPGPGAVYLSQKMEFISPAYLGETITAEVEIIDIQKVVLTCSTVATATDRNQIVMKGEARIMLPREKRRREKDI